MARLIDQKICNPVNTVMNMGSLALSKEISELKCEKLQILDRIQKEEEKLTQKHIDAEAVVNAYHKARELFLNDVLPEQRQLINLFLDAVAVYPDYVKVYIKSIPDSVHKDNNSNTIKNVEKISASELDSDYAIIDFDENNNFAQNMNVKLFAEKSYFGTGSRAGIENEITKPCNAQDLAKDGGAEGNDLHFLSRGK